MSDVRTAPRAPGRRPPIEPRIAQRWIAARRQEGRRRLRVLAAGGAAAVVALILLGLIYSPAFDVRHVRAAEARAGGAGVAPAGAPTVGQLASVAGVSGHRLMIRVNPAVARRRLDADPWLSDARVERNWPDTLSIAATVRVPVALFATGPANAPTGYAEVDSTGRVLALSAAPPAGLPLIKWPGSVPAPGGWLAGTAGDGADPASPAGRLTDMDAASDAADVPSVVAGALTVLDALPASVRADVISVATTPELSLLVVPPGAPRIGVQFVFGDGSQLQAKTTALLTLVGQANLSGVASVDLAVPSRPQAASASG